MTPYVNLVRGDKQPFDVIALAATLDHHPLAFRDPSDPSQEVTYWICHNAEQKEMKEQAFQQGDRYGFYSMGFITLRSTFLTIGLETLRETLVQMSTIVIPIIQQFSCEIANEYGLNLTTYYRDHPERLFDPDWIPPEVAQAIDEAWARQAQLWQAHQQRHDEEME